MSATGKKKKCRYWDQCYQNNVTHKKRFLHPDDLKDEEENAADTSDLGTKASSGGINMVSSAAAAATTSLVKRKQQKAKRHDMSDSSDAEDVVPSLVRTRSQTKSSLGKPSDEKQENSMEVDEEKFVGTTTLKRTRSQTRTSQSDDDDDDLSGKKQKVSNDEQDDVAAAGTFKIKCKYWAKCYREDLVHLRTYLHPSETNDVAGSPPPKVIKPKYLMADGTSITLSEGYVIKRTGNEYTCTCPEWKNQSKAVDSRTCTHLKDYLGAEFENVRTGGSIRPKRNPATAAKSWHKPMPQLMLAHKWEENKDPTDWWISEKYDGVRAYWDGHCFRSRLGNKFIPPAFFIKDFPTNMELDGELFEKRGSFQTTVSIVKTQGDEKWKSIKYLVFDAPNLKNLPFEKRMDELKKYFAKNKAEKIDLVEQTKCKSQAHLNEELQKVLDLGGEGLMIRKPKSQYENCRSHSLLKIKKFHDAEAIVVGHLPGKGRNSGRVGSLRCKMECGKEFSVGSGLSDQDRGRPPKIGTIITYKFQELTNSGSPRFPTYIGIRLDMTEPKDAVIPKKKSD